MKQSFEREAEILGSSLGDGNVTEKEIISNINILKDIAIMCETMVRIAHLDYAYICQLSYSQSD